ncbi:hypothetical protein BDV35DRAFT_198904 [Aspergillus flavus]|uniref:Uncharacterized protein n=1 Tax=Aspergillus flavus TaxID=5059 RepID=A0A5N6GZ92_ASPFL|nr:hypothetical protein BDV35DRAFT_198904 [Aspergillus flavus]
MYSLLRSGLLGVTNSLCTTCTEQIAYYLPTEVSRSKSSNRKTRLKENKEQNATVTEYPRNRTCVREYLDREKECYAPGKEGRIMKS